MARTILSRLARQLAIRTVTRVSTEADHVGDDRRLDGDRERIEDRRGGEAGLREEDAKRDREPITYPNAQRGSGQRTAGRSTPVPRKNRSRRVRSRLSPMARNTPISPLRSSARRMKMPMISIAPATMEKSPRTRNSVEILLAEDWAPARALARSWSAESPRAVGMDARVAFRVVLTCGASARRLAWSPTLVTG